MAPDEVSHIDLVTAALALNYFQLEAQKVATVLQNKLRERVQQLTRLLGIDAEAQHLLEDTSQVGDLGREHAARLVRQPDDLGVRETVLLENTEELRNLPVLQAEHVGEAAHNLHVLLVRHLQVQVEEEQLRLELDRVVLTDESGAVLEKLKGRLALDTVLSHDSVVLLQLLDALGEVGGVAHCQVDDAVHLNAVLLVEHADESLETKPAIFKVLLKEQCARLVTHDNFELLLVQSTGARVKESLLSFLHIVLK